MFWWQALIIGLIQGATEFLPVSSSGHLAVAYKILGVSQEPVVLSVILHFFTLLAVLVYFKKIILDLQPKQLFVLAVASIPAGLVGILIKDLIDSVFTSLLTIGLLFSLTGLANMVGNHFLSLQSIDTKKKLWSWPSFKQALIIGLAQAVAILPGVSRSGITIATGLTLGAKKQSTFNFSFLLSLPAVSGAFLLEMFELRATILDELNFMVLLAGLVAFVTGYLSLKILSLVLKKAQLKWFGFYVLVLSLVVVFVELF